MMDRRGHESGIYKGIGFRVCEKAGGDLLLESLRTNKTLEALDVSDNDLSKLPTQLASHPPYIQTPS